jgi:hypothetical protein
VHDLGLDVHGAKHLYFCALDCLKSFHRIDVLDTAYGPKAPRIL